MKYKRKSIIVEALQFNNLNRTEVEAFTGQNLVWELESEAAYLAGVAPPISSLTIPTLEGNMKAMPGDFIIKGVNGEFYPCKPDIFHKSYELVDNIIIGNGQVSTD